MTHPMPVETGYSATMPEMPSGQTGPAHFRIRRSGARPLSFAGTELAMAMSFTPELPYWYEINVFRTDSLKFVLAIKLFFVSEHETDTSDAWEFDSLADLLDAVEAYDASRDVRFDPGCLDTASPADLAARAMALQADIGAARAHFAALAGALFKDMDEAA